MAMLASLEAVKANNKIPSDDTSKDALLTAWIEAASWVLEQFTHRFFEKKERTEYFEGGLRNLCVKAYPTESVSSVKVNGKEVDGYVIDPEIGVIHLASRFGSRDEAYGYEVEVVYTGGYDEMPAAVTQACLLLTDRFYASAEEEGQLVQSEKLGDYSITYAKYSVGDDASGLGVFCPGAQLLIRSLSGRGF